jgi:hypothetical protein
MGYLALGAFFSTLPWSAEASESHLREAPQAITLWTEDGLRLTLDRATGQALEMAVGARIFPLSSKPLIRFEEVLEVPNAPDLLGDGSFRDGPGAWEIPEGSLEEAEAAATGRWLRLSGPGKPFARREVELHQEEAQPLILAGWCRAEMHTEAAGWMNAHLALNAYGIYADGSRMPEQSAYFGQYDHGPQFNRKVLCPDRPLDRLEIVLTTPGGECKAWYRDVTLRPARYRIASPNGPVERIDARVVQDFGIPEASLRGLVTYQPLREALEIRCRLEDSASPEASPGDRAISAYLALPFDAVGGLWHDDFRTSRRIEPGQLYRNAKWYGAGRDGYDSRYPLAALETAEGVGLALATAIDEPRVFQIEYDAQRRELRLRYDLGLSPAAGTWARRGSFTAYLFRYQAGDGFRGATEKYHRLFDWAFLDKRVRREGLWLAFISPHSIPGGSTDFHFQFVEATGNLGWETQQGMVSFKYLEPWIIHHESPPHAPFEETRGPVDPQGALNRARQMAHNRDPQVPPDSRYRYAAYLGSYIEDNWGQPQGYFFRNPQGRNENMMIVNPNPALPPPPGTPFSSGGLDWEILMETAHLWKQWSLEGWNLYRTGERPCLEIDTVQKASGQQSVRFDPIRSKGYWEQYVRGFSQVVYYRGVERPGAKGGPGRKPANAAREGPENPMKFEFSFSARAENEPPAGTGLRWMVEFQYGDDTVEPHFLPLEGLGGEWRRFHHALQASRRPFAITVLLVNAPWFPDPTVLWIDDVRLTVAGEAENLLLNGDFEKAELLPGRLGGVYLDTMECYTNNLNYRRSHWLYADEPLTFDGGRRPALQQQFSHVSYARRMAEWARPRGLLLFGNCAPGTCFGAPYLDILGGEENWMPAGKWSPQSDADFNYVRFMARAKPFCLLQYADLDAEHLERYFQRCLFYGVFPGNQSTSPTSGKWYWTNPVRVARDRRLYARYMPLLIEITRAGWQPLTLARSDPGEIWLERFGEGETFYLTAFNPTAAVRSARITLDPRAGVTRRSRIQERVEGREVDWSGGGKPGSFKATLGPEEVRVFQIRR